MRATARWPVLLAASAIALVSGAKAGAEPGDGGAAPGPALRRELIPDGKGPPGPAATPEESAECLGCHKDRELDIELQDGKLQSMYVDAAALGASIHAKLGCSDCHSDLKGKTNGHDERPFRNQRHLAQVYSEQCKQCHFANYTRTLDGVHHALIAKGNERPAMCVDCHGAHDVSSASKPRSKVSRTCARCHEEIATRYAKSVHGKALLDDENPDVPTCTDCHRAHDIADPRTSAWRLKMPQMCGNCHSDGKMMAKYGLSTNVLATYLADFHGSTALLQQGDKDARAFVALCTDCHGVHDIVKVKGPRSQVIAANLVKTCQKCHTEATAGFQSAWMSHYEPTWEKAPLVYAVKAGYAVLIPFMITGLLLQIFLHLWRVVVNR